MADSLSVIILAAGQGTRMKSRIAKVLHTLCGQPMLFFPVERARELGADRIVVVLGFQHEQVESALRARFGDAEIQIALQEEQLGTAHAVQQAAPLLSGATGPVLILYGDVPLLRGETLARLHAAYRTGGLALVTARPEDPRGYGR